MPRRPTAFTLAELLVVIGIIAVLLALVLGALNRSRGAARSVACLAQQREVGRAMLGGAAETGYLPLAGEVVLPPGIAGYGSLPPALGDAGREKYAYRRDDDEFYFSAVREQVLPPPYALLPRLADGAATVPPPATNWHEAVEANPTLEMFHCPEVDRPRYVEGRWREYLILWTLAEGASADDSDGWTSSWDTAADYGFNGGLMGFHHADVYTPSRRRGLLTRSGPASQVMLLADADNGRGRWGSLSSLQPRLSTAPQRVTLRDAAEGNAKVTPATVPIPSDRHGGRVNVAFADGHAAAADDLGDVLLTE